MEDPTELICTRLIDMKVMHPDQVTLTCHECGLPVGVYPSGQKALKRYPKMEITCAKCAEMTPQRLVEDAFPAGSIEEIIQETRDSKPVGKA